jgi:DNA mismatch repair protein MutS
MIIDDYLEYSKTYKSKYGDKCIILMQVGSFYELYSIEDSIADNDIYCIVDLCNIQISRKNKSIPEVSISNPLMAGFPLYTISKYTQILLNNNYTIVLVEQVTEPPNPERKVTEILSPGMNITVQNKKSNFMMVLYYEFIDRLLVVGISGIDLSTGKTFIYEAGSTKKDPEFACDEVFRFISTYNPSELVILSSSKLSAEDKSYILKNLNVNNILTHFKWDNYEYIDIMKKLVYQKGILEKAFFSKKTMLSIIEVLNLEKLNTARISFCCLLQFAYEHNADIIKELQEPVVFEDHKNMCIEFNSALQLNVLGLYQGDKPLIDILNRCSTSFGCRAFKDRILMPMVNHQDLCKSYDDIDRLLKNNLFKDVRRKLSDILDLERLKRRMLLNKISPMDWCSFNTSLLAARHVVELLQESFDYDSAHISEIIDGYTSIDLEEASKHNLTDKNNMGNFFVEGTYADIDIATNEYNSAYEKIKSICETVNSLGQNDATACKIEYNDREGHYLCMTKKRFDTAAAINKTLMTGFDKKALSNANNYRLVNADIMVQSSNMQRYSTSISTLVLKYYHDFVASYITKHADAIDNLVKYLTRIDIACCCARNAYEYCYTRPVIKPADKSYVKATNMRHPIIERIDDTLPYVGNEIELGVGSHDSGILLYGINASGKSSFMKAVGLNIIMAQAGMFVACSSFEFQPYHHIFTRISGMDNIYKGMSSFTVEMTELRNILQRCNKHSLVIGDEICCGTEFISALAIVASGIDTLVKKNTSFIFATHLHELTKLKVIKEHMKNAVCIKHMHIHIDDKNRIIYDRKLQEGQGSQVYGIEVCKSLDMPNDFMKNAEVIRKEVQGLDTMIINKKKSRYNAKVLMDKCAVCGDKAVDTHHVKYQASADAAGFLESYHKNVHHNLVPLCKECHIQEHNGSLNIEGYIQTSDGIMLCHSDSSTGSNT